MKSATLMAAAAALLIGACTPPYIDKAQLRFAKDFYRGCDRDRCAVDERNLSLDQLYAIHLYGRSFHPWRSRTGEFVRRGAETIPFLRARLEAARDGGEIGSLFEIFQAMRRAGSYDIGGDRPLVAAIQAAAHRVKDPGFHLRDQADEIETGEERPFSPAAVRKWNEGYGRDYDLAFAKSHCRGCDFRDWKAGIEQLPVDKLYALHRYGWEHFLPTRNVERQLAERGGAAIPLLKAKLAQADRGLMLLNILSVLELMRDIGTYDPARDPELLAMADAAAARVGGDYSHWNREAALRLRTDTPHPLAELRAPFPRQEEN